MPFPIAHSLVCASLISLCNARLLLQKWTLLVLCIILGNLPDIDFFFVWFMHWDENWHRGFTHSVSFAVLIGIATAILISYLKKQKFSWRWAVLFILLIASHGILDTLTTPKADVGVQLFWPFSRTRFATDFLHYQSTLENFENRHQPPIFWTATKQMLLASIYELLIFGTLFLVVYFFSKIFNKRAVT